MACDTELIEYICQAVAPIGFVRPKKMFGEWMIYIDEKPIILVCDNTPYIKMLPEIAHLMAEAEVGCPYPGAKTHYILDIAHRNEALEVLHLMLPLIPYPKKRKSTPKKIMSNKALVVIDIQNDITKNYKEIISNINTAIDWAERCGIHIVYIKHNNITAGTRTFKPDTRGAELVSEMKVISDNIFIKTKGNALTSEAFAQFITENNISVFFLAGADATACVKSTAYNMAKAGYDVTILSDCITSYDLSKIDEMLHYYASKGCAVKPLCEVKE